jgi:amino acid permease
MINALFAYMGTELIGVTVGEAEYVPLILSVAH